MVLGDAELARLTWSENSKKTGEFERVAYQAVFCPRITRFNDRLAFWTVISPCLAFASVINLWKMLFTLWATVWVTSYGMMWNVAFFQWKIIPLPSKSVRYIFTRLTFPEETFYGACLQHCVSPLLANADDTNLMTVDKKSLRQLLGLARMPYGSWRLSCCCSRSSPLSA